MSDLPNSWSQAILDEVALVEMGQSPDSRTYNTEGNGLPFFQGKAEFRDTYPEIRKWCSVPTKVAEQGDILLSIRAPVGPTNLAPERCCIGRGLAGIRAEEGVNQLYVYHFLKNIGPWLSDQGTGSTFAAISGQFVREIATPVAPAAEQTRIVAKLEELLSDLDAGVAELNVAQKKLHQYRQSILKAAVGGELTAAWRETQRKRGSPTETGDQLLQRILIERRAQWEVKQLVKFKEQGKTTPQDWQKKYPEPAGPNTTDLPGLPKGWVWASVDQLSPDDLANGRSVPTAENGAKVLRLTAIRDGKVDLTESKNGAWTEKEARPFRVTKGDLLVVRGNGSLSLVGRAGLVGVVDEPVAYPDTLIRLRVTTSIVAPAWIAAMWESGVVRKHLERRARTSAGIYKISQPDIVSVQIPVPPIAEQYAALEMLNALSVELALIAQAATNALKQSGAQRQNILRAAFAGRLVPQDQGDEPASILLERILAERAERAEVAKVRNPGKGKHMNKTDSEPLATWIHAHDKLEFSFEDVKGAMPAIYEALKSELFQLLAAERPVIRQFFDHETGTLRFRRNTQ